MFSMALVIKRNTRKRRFCVPLNNMVVIFPSRNEILKFDMLIWRYYRFDGINHFRGTLETSLLSLLPHIEGVNAIQKPLFFKMKEIFYVKGNSTNYGTKTTTYF